MVKIHIMNDLSPREQEIFDLLLAGSAPKEIAFTLNITYDTVKAHQKRIYKKLDVKNIKEFLLKFKNNNDISELWKDSCRPAIFERWNPFRDPNSTVKFEESYEEIEGQVEKCFTLSGELSGIPHVFAGVHGMPDTPTLKALRTMKSFSFKVLGDGLNYQVKLQTPETTFTNNDHYLYFFPTKMKQITSIVVNVPGDLTRAGWSGTHVDFNQNNVQTIVFQPVDYWHHYKLKFWDFKLYG